MPNFYDDGGKCPGMMFELEVVMVSRIISIYHAIVTGGETKRSPRKNS